jgi:putative ABC transport system permease protein
MVTGIALGVAVVVAIDLANAGASRAFDLSVEAVTGRATHQITGGPAGLDESLYSRLRRDPGGTRLAAPVIHEYVSSPQLGDRPLQLLGIDPFAEAPFRDYLSPSAAQESGTVLSIEFFTQPGTVLISAGNATRYGLLEGDTIQLDVGGRERSAVISGIVQPADDLGSRALADILLCDIATAQELTGRPGRLDRIDLLLPEDEPQALERIRSLLPPSVHISPVQARSGAVQQMTAAFRTNLTALSLLALVVGLFLIYNTMTFSVVQRRALFGTLRCLGVTRREVFLMVVIEAVVAGLAGATAGVALGIALGQGAVRLVTQTINDLYFVVNVQGASLAVSSLVKGAVLGIGATVLAATPPAWEAASVPPRAALSRSGLERKARKAVALAAVGGLASSLLGAALLALPGRSLVVSFAGTFGVIVGCAMLAPLATRAFMRGATPLAGSLWGALGRMGPRDVVNSLSRTSVAVAALMVAVSVTIGVSLMVTSFRHTVIAWLAETLQGDVYIASAGAASQSAATIDLAAVETAGAWPGVERADVLRAVTVNSPAGPVDIAATDNETLPLERVFLAVDGSPGALWRRMESPEAAVLVSEPLANRLNLPRRGGIVTLYTDQGPRDFPVAGIFYDYTSSQGIVLMALPIYRELWADEAITAIALRLPSNADVEQTVRDLQDRLGGEQRLIVRSNRTLRQEALTIFDRTFAITGAMQLLATAVAFIGVLSTMLSLQMEKQHELGVLRAVGLTVRQLWGLVLLETGLMGASAGLLAMPTGFALALILVYVINRRSFGWTLQMQVEPGPFILALGVALAAALLAGIYPARRIGRMVTAEALRYE